MRVHSTIGSRDDGRTEVAGAGRRTAGSARPTTAGRSPSAVRTSLVHLQRAAGNQAVAQRLGAAPEPGLSASTADRPAPTEMAFPHATRLAGLLERSVPGRAVVDPLACGRAGVQAYTDGTTTHFSRPDPSLEVAAHEAVHQLQHVGTTRDMGLDPEQQAAAVGRRVREGGAVAGLLGPQGGRVPAARRPYTEVPTSAQRPGHWAAGVHLRVSDDGRMAAEQSGAYGTHELWASVGLVSRANALLTARGSVVRLRTRGATIAGPAPDRTGGTRRLSEVQPENVATRTRGDTMAIWADCGRSARDVMGVGGGTGRNHARVTATYTASGKVVQTAASAPSDMADEVVKESLGAGTSAAAGWARYRALTPAARAAFDRRTGVNRYARPGVGEGYTMASGGAPFPGVSTWNFHWAGVVLRSGGDTVTLENYAVGVPDAVNSDWNFQMYGPPSRRGQTFHDQHLATRQHGATPTTLAVRPR